MSRDRLNAHDAAALLKRGGASDAEIGRQLGGRTCTVAEAKEGKYKNSRCWSALSGRTFMSKGEQRLADVLWLRQKAGEISALTFQPRVKLLGAICMIPDFRYVEDGVTIHHEFKGMALATWIIQRKLWALVGPTEYRVTYAGNKPDEIIHPAMTDELLLAAARQMARRWPVNMPLWQAINQLEGQGQ